MKKPKIICLCGSFEWLDVMAVCAWLIERDEKAVTLGLHLLPTWFYPLFDYEVSNKGIFPLRDRFTENKIRMSDEMFVVNYGNHKLKERQL